MCNRSGRRPAAWAGMATVAVLAAGLLAAGLLAGGPGASAWAQETPAEIRIGATLSQSGVYLPIVGPFGKLADAWADSVNAKGGIFLKQYGKALPVKFVTYDDRSEPTTALSLYERLATVDKVDVFLGPFSSGMNNAAMQAAATHQIPFFIPEGNDPALYSAPNPWRASALALADDEYTRVAQIYAKLAGVKTFAILARDNLHETGAAAGFAAMLGKAGYQVVYQETAPRDTKDFASIVLKMKQANPDVVAVESLAPPWTIQFFKQARELGLAPKDAIAAHMPVPVIKALGGSAENIVSLLWSFEGDTPDHKEFMALCAAAGIQPWEYSEAGVRYVTYKWIEDTLKRAGTLDHEAVRKAMWEADFTLFGDGHYKINGKGYGSEAPYPTQIRNGRHVSTWPLDKAVPAHVFKDGKW
jgi:ABC-type branched-subunit amino acid transport system substrate-binding protein